MEQKKIQQLAKPLYTLRAHKRETVIKSIGIDSTWYYVSYELLLQLCTIVCSHWKQTKMFINIQ